MRVAPRDALVDDVGVQARQEQHGDGGRELQGHDQGEPPAVRREVGADQPQQHQVSFRESAVEHEVGDLVGGEHRFGAERSA